MFCRLLALAALGLVAAAARADFADEAPHNWHAWRGPHATGVAPYGNPPLAWDGATNVKWKVPVEGRGNSSPIVWGDRIFLLTAVDTGQSGPTGARRNLYQFKVLCFDRRTGERLWDKVARIAAPHETLHETNTYASSSPTTDGAHLYVSFGSHGVYCYDLDGELKWERDLGLMNTRREFGEGASPTIHGDTLVLNWDQEENSAIIALDAATGADKWRQPRDEVTTWNTPLVVEGAGRTQVVINATNRARGYDLATGALLWECGGQTVNAIASPVRYGDKVICMSGFRGNAVYAIPIDAQGDVTGTDRVAWHWNKSGPYVASPILYDDRVYFGKERTGILTCLDAATGEPLIDQHRLPRISDMYASPVGAAGRIYFTSRDGVTLVIRHADEVEILAANDLGEPVDASPAIVGDDIFIRSHSHLYCLGEGK